MNRGGAAVRKTSTAELPPNRAGGDMNDIHNQAIAQRIDWLFDLARRHGETFRRPEAWLARQRYIAEHPTAIAVLKCMDGRINIPFATPTKG